MQGLVGAQLVFLVVVSDGDAVLLDADNLVAPETVEIQATKLGHDVFLFVFPIGTASDAP